MSRPRPLNEKELQFLRRLAFRKGVPEHKHSQDKQVIELVLKRGLAEDVEHRCGTRIAITKSGMIEVAKSGRFTVSPGTSLSKPRKPRPLGRGGSGLDSLP